MAVPEEDVREIRLTDHGPEPVRVLLVENDERFALLVKTLLVGEAAEFDVVWAPRISTALARLARLRIDIVLTDLSLQDTSGPATVRYLVRAAPSIPIIVLSGTIDIETVLACIQEGAEEYVIKRALEADALVRLIRTTLGRHRRASGPDACHDPLTGEAGPAALEAIGTQLLATAERSGWSVSVLSLRLVGDGSMLGNEPARVAEVAQILRRTVRRCDVIARVDTGELAVILVGQRAGAEVANRRVRRALVSLRGGVQLRVGLATFAPEAPQTIQQLLSEARQAFEPVQS
jgi:PleD family two-component response regulator